MAKRYVEEIIETLDKFMVSNGCEIIFNNNDQARAYRLADSTFWITYTVYNTWWISCRGEELVTRCNDYNIVDRTVEFDSTGKAKEDFFAILDKIKELLG